MFFMALRRRVDGMHNSPSSDVDTTSTVEHWVQSPSDAVICNFSPFMRNRKYPRTGSTTLGFITFDISANLPDNTEDDTIKFITDNVLFPYRNGFFPLLSGGYFFAQKTVLCIWTKYSEPNTLRRRKISTGIFGE